MCSSISAFKGHDVDIRNVIGKGYAFLNRDANRRSVIFAGFAKYHRTERRTGSTGISRIVAGEGASGDRNTGQTGFCTIIAVITCLDMESGTTVCTVAAKGTAVKGNILIDTVFQVDIQTAQPCLKTSLNFLWIGTVIEEFAVGKAGISQFFKISALDIAVLNSQVVGIDPDRIFIIRSSLTRRIFSKK